MTLSPALESALSLCIESFRPGTVVETGTYLGDGSTTAVANAFCNSPPRDFHTIEASWHYCEVAKRNLARFPFVTVVWGLSVTLDQAIEFLRTDPFVNGGAPRGLLVDSDDPYGFYMKELRGNLGGAAPDNARPREGLLRELLVPRRASRPLIVLDSAGGIGWLEFQTVLRIQQDNAFALLLDDINHVKHYRSALHLGSDRSFDVLGHSASEGWLLAVRDPRA